MRWTCSATWRGRSPEYLAPSETLKNPTNCSKHVKFYTAFHKITHYCTSFTWTCANRSPLFLVNGVLTTITNAAVAQRGTARRCTSADTVPTAAWLYKKSHLKSLALGAWPQRSLKVIENGVIRRAIYSVLLVVCCSNVCVSFTVSEMLSLSQCMDCLWPLEVLRYQYDIENYNHVHAFRFPCNCNR